MRGQALRFVLKALFPVRARGNVASQSGLAVAAAVLLTWAGAGQASAQENIYGIDVGKYPGWGVNSKANPGIASGSHSGYYIRFAEDLATLCSRPMTPGSGPFRLNVIATQGGFDSVKRLRLESDVQLAVVQSDLWYYAKMYGDPASGTGSWLSEKTRTSWRQVAEDVRLLVPLFTEKIHIVVSPYGKDKFGDLMGLFRNNARVSVGTNGSGSMITCSLLEEMILRHLRAKGEPPTCWRPQYLSPDAALEELVKEESELDAVILVGAVPFPALDKFGMQEVKKSGGIFSKSVRVAPLALLPIGAEADALFDQNPEFRGYIKTSIRADEYEFLTGEKGEIPTRGVTACLVTHKSYASDASAEELRKRLFWVRHILFRLLTSLDQGSDHGLNREFGVPEAGDKWKEVWEHLSRMEGGELSWDSYGWKRHDDLVLRRMVDAWAGSYESRPATRIIDPDTF